MTESAAHTPNTNTNVAAPETAQAPVTSPQAVVDQQSVCIKPDNKQQVAPGMDGTVEPVPADVSDNTQQMIVDKPSTIEKETTIDTPGTTQQVIATEPKPADVSKTSQELANDAMDTQETIECASSATSVEETHTEDETSATKVMTNILWRSLNYTLQIMFYNFAFCVWFTQSTPGKRNSDLVSCL